jgi:NCAIR mutase (PurE)-related protein
MQDQPPEPFTLDLDRQQRCGYPEVVYGEGKDLVTLTKIIGQLRENETNVLVTRLDVDKAEQLANPYPDGQYNALARTWRLDVSRPSAGPPPMGAVTIVTAGTSDLPVAEEARETLRWMDVEPVMVHDVGVAGPHRLPAHLESLRNVAAVVVVAGMEGALPSVVGGYVDCPVIAVPTSVGYGANLGGITALLGMLNSCAANVTVVNVDAGFKGGYVAGLIARRCHKASNTP